KRGVFAGHLDIDKAALFRHRDSIVNRLVKGIEYLLRKNGVAVVRGEVKRVSRGLVNVEGFEKPLSFDKLIIATGSSPKILGIPGLNKANVISGDDAVNVHDVPARVLMVGGGAIGVELAQIFKALGSEVYVVEIMPHVLPQVDSEVAVALQKMLSRDGIHIYTGTTINKFEKREHGVLAYLSSGDRIAVDSVIMAVGRKPNSGGLGLEEVGVVLGSSGEVVTDEHMRTSAPDVYAAGDVVGKYYLAYTAFEEGVVAAENAMGLETRINYEGVPKVIFTDPEVASIGMSEEEARSSLGEVVIGRFPFSANGRALTLNSYEGFVKVIADKKGRLLGVHIIGPEASEIIHVLSPFFRRVSTLQELVNFYYAHPTLSEAVKEAALVAMGKALHL
ncbi:MAG: FAD-dependent oxidoreductase, partial [Desulfurococcaceae archaeon]